MSSALASIHSDAMAKTLVGAGSDPQRSTACSDEDTAIVTFKTCDGVLFPIHRKNLDTSTGSFAPAEFASKPGDTVTLAEDAKTLELLFKFVYPSRHPALAEVDTPFPVLAALSEAAEKYEVFAAMNVCNIRMEQALVRYPVQVLNYGAKHGYPELVKAAVPLLLDMPIENVVQTLLQHLVVPWIIFRQRWSEAVVSFVQTPIEGTNFLTNDKKKTCKWGCVHGGGLIGDMWQSLGEKRSVEAVVNAYASLRPPCTHVTIDTVEIRARLVAELQAIPDFSP